MRNTLGDLNNHLFMQLERLNDEDIKDDELQEEINRSKAITSVATAIIKNGNLVLNAQRLKEDRINADVVVPRMLEGDK